MTTTSATDTTVSGVHYDSARSGLVIDDLLVSDSLVLAEAQHWSAGQRGASVTREELDGVDLEPFVQQALTVGAQAIRVAGAGQDKYEFQQLVDDFSARTRDAAADASDRTAGALAEAASALTKAADDGRLALEANQKAAADAMADSVARARAQVNDEVGRLFGGDDPEFGRRLQPVLDAFARELAESSQKHTQAIIDRATRQLDADDPTSPMARQAKALKEQQDTLRHTVEQSAADLSARVDELTRTVAVAHAAKEAARAADAVGTAKGVSFEDEVHVVLDSVAAQLGDTYARTGATVSRRSTSKKGDGVLTVVDAEASVVVEMTHDKTRDWVSYLKAAEQARGAQASLGVVPSPDHLGGEVLRTFGGRRVVMAFNPEEDDPALLAAVVKMLRLAAIAARGRGSSDGIDTAEEKLAEAVESLASMLAIEKTANEIRGKANKIASTVGALHTNLERLLGEARAALGAASGADGIAAPKASSDHVAAAA